MSGHLSYTGREWRLRVPPGTPLLTSNQRQHWAPRSRQTRELRELAAWLARAQNMPRLRHAHVFGQLLAYDRRRRDPANWEPTAKALLDGLVDAGVLADDDFRHVTGPDMRIVPAARPGPLGFAMLVREMEVSPRH